VTIISASFLVRVPLMRKDCHLAHHDRELRGDEPRSAAAARREHWRGVLRAPGRIFEQRNFQDPPSR
jgi:hypothetical protein